MTNLENIASFEHLYEAHKKCRLGKRNEKTVIEFEMNLAFELMRLEQELKNYTYRVGPYHEFMIYDPKKRIIQALGYRDRVVQHSLCDNILQPYLEPKLIYDNSACRLGKGTHFAMNRLSGFMRTYYRKYGCGGYILKFDIRKYFDSIPHVVLFQQLQRVFADDREMQGLLRMIIESYESAPGRGLPMGNQTSQWFGLYYLNGLDHYIKEKLRIKFYTRYMDDGILLHHDKAYLKECLYVIEEKVTQELGLEFNAKTQIVPMSQGVDYLGFHFYLTETGKVIRRLRTSSKKRWKRKMKRFKHAYREDKISLDGITRSLVSYKGHLSHGHTHAMYQNTLRGFVLCKGRTP